MLSRNSVRTLLRSSRSIRINSTVTPNVNKCTLPLQNDYSRILSRSYVTITKFNMLPVKVVDVPSMGDSITEGTIVDVPVGPGDFVETDEVVLVLETDKVSVDVRASEAGKIVEILGGIDEVVEVGSPLYRIDTDAVGTPNKKETIDTEEDTLKSTPDPEPSSPPASEKTPNVKASTNTAPAPVPPPKKETSSPPRPKMISSAEKFRSERRSKLSRMRQRVASRLKEAQNTAAMLTTFQEVDMSALMEMRARYKDEFLSKHGVKLGFMSSFVKASTAALQEIPAVNAYIDDVAQEIVYREFCDISVAVASPNGLVVPVLRNTEFMSFADVEKTIRVFGTKAQEGTLALDDMAGGTFTISNGGVFGSLMGTPILNPPQSAILGMHATKMRPVVIDGEIIPRPMMYLALTYDHRLIDGREAVTFLQNIAGKVADPSRLLLEL